jgi:chromosome partitioning protein
VIDYNDFIEAINDGFIGRQWLILVLSPDSVVSPWVKMEVNAALARVAKGHMRAVIPIVARSVDTLAVPILWDALQRYDATRDYDAAVGELLDALKLSRRSLLFGPPTLKDGPLPKRKGRTLAVASQKGGGGKTTTTINLGACLAAADYKTLVIDLDPQSNTTTGLGIDAHRVGNSIYELLVNDNITVNDVLRADIRPNLSLIPAKVDLYAADIELVYIDHREFRLKRILDSMKDTYDFVLIDCPPSLGLLTVNALTSADGVVLPLQCEYFALEGMQQLLNTIKLVRDRLNPKVFLFGVVLTMYDPRTRLAAEVVDEITQHFPKEKFQSMIPRNVRLSEAPSYGLTILEHEARSPGALAYKALAEEVIERANSMEAAHV